MLDLPVTTKLPIVWRVLAIIVWLTVFIITTVLYIKKGCPHTQKKFTSSCIPYTYPPGLLPSFPTTYSFKNITLKGNPYLCSTVDFHFYVTAKSPGFTWDFFSDINCIGSADEPHVFSAYANLPPPGSVLDLTSRIYAALGHPDLNATNTSELKCFYGGGSNPNKPLGTCTIVLSDGSPFNEMPITQQIFDMLDNAPSLARLLSFDTAYSCNRCTADDITFRNFTAYVAGTASYLSMATAFILLMAGLFHTTDINKIRGKNDMGNKSQEYSPIYSSPVHQYPSIV